MKRRKDVSAEERGLSLLSLSRGHRSAAASAEEAAASMACGDFRRDVANTIPFAIQPVKPCVKIG
jgi:hypothetical protein